MVGVATELDLGGLAPARDLLSRISALDLDQLGGEEIGALLENSTKRRLQDEKTDPDGNRWVAWSATYDATRDHGTHSLLIGENHLLTSIQHFSNSEAVRIGSNLIYAAIHQFGADPAKAHEGSLPGAEGAGIPARPYLGVSEEDRRDIERLVIGRLEDLLP
ncbi:MAG: phage virion morphogenesis protein [Cereibacter changlensis]